MPTHVGITGGITEYLDNDRGTYTAAAAILGGQMVALNANRAAILTVGDDVKAVGVALHDAAIGDPVTVATAGVWPIKAAGAITAGSKLACGAVAGTVKAAAATPDARTLVGVAQEDIADTATGRVRLGGAIS
jgi:predicted RecA/RadA family phage recombinase